MRELIAKIIQEFVQVKKLTLVEGGSPIIKRLMNLIDSAHSKIGKTAYYHVIKEVSTWIYDKIRKEVDTENKPFQMTDKFILDLKSKINHADPTFYKSLSKTQRISFETELREAVRVCAEEVNKKVNINLFDDFVKKYLGFSKFYKKIELPRDKSINFYYIVNHAEVKEGRVLGRIDPEDAFGLVEELALKDTMLDTKLASNKTGDNPKQVFDFYNFLSDVLKKHEEQNLKPKLFITDNMLRADMLFYVHPGQGGSINLILNTSIYKKEGSFNKNKYVSPSSITISYDGALKDVVLEKKLNSKKYRKIIKVKL